MLEFLLTYLRYDENTLSVARLTHTTSPKYAKRNLLIACCPKLIKKKVFLTCRIRNRPIFKTFTRKNSRGAKLVRTLEHVENKEWGKRSKVVSNRGWGMQIWWITLRQLINMAHVTWIIKKWREKKRAYGNWGVWPCLLSL